MKKLDRKKIIAAAEAMDGRGFCTACGHEACEVEPDAHEYECENCGEPAVYGAEELIVAGHID